MLIHPFKKLTRWFLKYKKYGISLNPKKCAFIDAPPHSLKNSYVNPKVKTTEGVGVHSLARSTSKVEGH
jgi:hypothetical protein